MKEQACITKLRDSLTARLAKLEAADKERAGIRDRIAEVKAQADALKQRKKDTNGQNT